MTKLSAEPHGLPVACAVMWDLGSPAPLPDDGVRQETLTLSFLVRTIQEAPEAKMQDISFTVHIFREGDSYVAHVPELDVSSCGDSSEAARRNIQDAVRGFLGASEEMGTLAEILEEAGYRREGDNWVAPEFVSLDRMAVGLG